MFVVINSTTKADKLTGMIDDCRATVLVTSDRQGELAAVVGPVAGDVAVGARIAVAAQDREAAGRDQHRVGQHGVVGDHAQLLLAGEPSLPDDVPALVVAEACR